jgi:hypothetical protein
MKVTIEELEAYLLDHYSNGQAKFIYETRRRNR